MLITQVELAFNNNTKPDVLLKGKTMYIHTGSNTFLPALMDKGCSNRF